MTSNNPLFIVGYPRSGTTLLSLICSSHDSISLRNNDDILMAFFNASVTPYGQINEDEFDRIISMSNKLEDFDHFINSISEKKLIKIKSILPADGWTIFQSFLSNGNQDSIIWGSKTHCYLWFYKFIIEKYKMCKFLIIVRDPRAVVLSNYIKHIAKFRFNKINTDNLRLDLIKFDEAKNYFIKTSHHWMAWHTKLTEIQKIIPSKYLKIIRYEDITSNPEQILKDLFSQINIEYNDDVINSKSRLTHDILNNPIKSYAHMNISKPIDKNINDKWKKIDKNLITIVEHICKNFMSNYGYICSESHSLLKSLYLNQYLDYRYNYRSGEINLIDSIMKFDYDNN